MIDATKSKYWAHFVNLYRAVYWTTAGLEKTHTFTDRQLKTWIVRLTRALDKQEEN